MPNFSLNSLRNLNTCDLKLVQLFNGIVKHFDCSVIGGSRGAITQMGYYHEGKSKLVYPLSRHNPKIDTEKVASILRCSPTMEDIVVAIVVAREEQLIEIDMLEPVGKSKAVDVIPYPHSWKFENDLHIPKRGGFCGIDMDVVHNIERWAMFIGFVKAFAVQFCTPIICGADWDGDNQMSDQKFDDWPHFELMD